MGYSKYVVPAYTKVCRRQGCPLVEVSKVLTEGKKVDIVIDSTGLKVRPEITSHVRSMGKANGR